MRLQDWRQVFSLLYNFVSCSCPRLFLSPPPYPLPAQPFQLLTHSRNAYAIEVSPFQQKLKPATSTPFLPSFTFRFRRIHKNQIEQVRCAEKAKRLSNHEKPWCWAVEVSRRKRNCELHCNLDRLQHSQSILDVNTSVMMGTLPIEATPQLHAWTFHGFSSSQVHSEVIIMSVTESMLTSQLLGCMIK